MRNDDRKNVDTRCRLSSWWYFYNCNQMANGILTFILRCMCVKKKIYIYILTVYILTRIDLLPSGGVGLKVER